MTNIFNKSVKMNSVAKCWFIACELLLLNTLAALGESQLLRTPSVHFRSETGGRAIAACRPRDVSTGSEDSCRSKVSLWLEEINKDMLEFNVLAADFAWEISVNPENPDLAGRGAQIDGLRSKWRMTICERISHVDVLQLDMMQRRQFYLLCRGANLNKEEAETLSIVLDNMQNIYTSSKICILSSNQSRYDNQKAIDNNREKDILNYLKTVDEAILKYEKTLNAENSIDIFSDNFNSQQNIEENDRKNGMPKKISRKTIAIAAKLAAGSDLKEGSAGGTCLSGEPDLERVMAHSRHAAVLEWSWLAWREKVGPPMKPLYQNMVDVKNSAARRKGYNDLGEIWREELEMPNLEGIADKLYQETRELYSLLHAVARFFLRKFYGHSEVSERGPIPAHLLGNMWAQNWDTILGVILPESQSVDLDKIIMETNWTTDDMVRRAEDFYTSMGLAPMTEKFWQHSYFGDDRLKNQNKTKNKEDNQERHSAKCHGTAANMFVPGDYRMIYCAALSMEDFYVIHHEMGHIEYYMSYEQDLPTIFQDGANTAFQESVGDAIMYAVMTPQHLQRLGLIKDHLVYLYTDNKQIKSYKSSNKHKNDIGQQKRMAHINFNEKFSNPTFNDKSSYAYNIEADSLNLNNLDKIINDVQTYSAEIQSNPWTTREPVLNDWLHYFGWNDDTKIKRGVAIGNEMENKDGFHMFDKPHENLRIRDFTNTIDGNHDHTDRKYASGDINGIDFDSILLLRQALTKIPQIPFGYIIDKYRWEIFSGKIQPEEYNTVFWDYVKQFQGVEPPGGEVRGEYYFDAGAKFHIPDNTPYVRYYLSSFLEVQMFRAMCQWSLFGDASPGMELPMPLHRCDMYGSKKAGRKLQEMMSKGSSMHWSSALKILTGDSRVSSDALLQYFKPLQTILQKVISKYNIPVGW